MSKVATIAVSFIFCIVHLTTAQLDFQGLKTIPQRGDGWEVTPGDLDGDGDMDIVFSTQDNPRLYALFNNNGEIQSTPVPISPEFNTEPNSVYYQPFVISDFDKDGTDEIIYYSLTPQASTKRVLVFKYNGQSFTTIATFNTPNANATSIATGDVNKDGKMDIMYIAGESYLLESNATGYAEKKITTSQISPFKVKISDIDGDTWPDLILHDTGFKISIYKNNKNGGFDFNQNVSSTSSMISKIQLADFNGDGLEDMVIAGNQNQDYLDLLTQLNSGAFQASKLNTPTSLTFGLDVGDYNNDTKIDIVTGGYVNNPSTQFGFTLLENTGAGFTTTFFGGPTISPIDIKFANLDADNHKEIVLMNFGKNIRLFDLNSPSFTQLKIIPFGNTFSSVYITDMDKDGYDDLISSNPFSSSIAVLRNKGDGEYEDPHYYFTGDMPSGVATGDFNNDGYPDIVYSSNYSANGSSIILSNQDGQLNDPSTISGSSTGNKIVLGDFNKDGNLDFYNGATFASGNGNGTFILGSSNLNNVYDYEATDFNNDGYTDVVASSSSGISIAHGQNGYNLQLVQNITTSKVVSVLAQGELSNDTYTDFLVIYNDGTVSIFTNSSTETFTETPITIQGTPSKVMINDLNKDGHNDFVLLVNNKNIVVYTGSANGTFTLFNTYPTDPWYFNQLLLPTQNDDPYLDILMLSNNGPIAYILSDLVVEPTAFPSNLNPTEITDISVKLTLDKGDGNGRLVFIREESTLYSLPVDNQFYIPDTKFGSGTPISIGTYVVMADNSTGLTITGLKENTSYSISAFEYSSNSKKTVINYFLGGYESVAFNTLKSQTITSLNIPSKLVSDVPFTVTTTASSNLPVTIELVSGSVTINNGLITIQNAGPVKLKLTQLGNNEFAAAPIQEYTFCVNPLVPTLSYAASTNNKYLITSSSATNNTWLKNNVLINGETSQTINVLPDGSYAVKVDYSGCSNTSATVANQDIIFTTITAKGEGQPDFTLSATASSSLPVSYELVSGGVSVSNSTVKINTPGPAKIKASQGGNNEFFPATSIENTFCVNPSVPTITYGESTNGKYTLISSSTVNNIWLKNDVVIEGQTSKTIEVTPDATYNVKVDYSGCSSISQPVSPQIISFPELTVTADASGFTIVPTTNSSLEITYEVVSGGIEINNSVISIISPGPAKIKASQGGSNNFFPFSSVEITFCVNPKKPTITAANTGLGQYTLTSSNDVNNFWFRNDSPISGATSKTYIPTQDGIYSVKVDYSGCFNTSLPTINLITGIEENDELLSLFPNPTSDKVYIEWPNQNPTLDRILILDSQGKQNVANYNLMEGLITVDIHSLAPGFFTLLLQTTKGSIVKKMIKN